MDSDYNTRIIQMINMRSEFCQFEHHFVISSRRIYEKVAHYQNVELRPNILKKEFKYFLEIAKQAKYIFIHSLSLSFYRMLSLRGAVAKKIIWCVWGHDLYRRGLRSISNMPCSERLLTILYRILFIAIFKYRIRQFHAIGIGFKYDALEVRRLFNRIPIVATPYSIGYSVNDIANVLESKAGSEEKESPVRIMIGHSAYSFLKHEEVLYRLKAYEDKNINIIIPLSYGDPSYAEYIEKIAKQLYPGKVETMRDILSLDKYLNLLANIDIAIFEHEHQSALGSIILLLYLQKKVYLKRAGIVSQGLKFEGIDTFDSNEIGTINFNELKNKPKTNERTRIILEDYLDDRIIEKWESTLKDLETHEVGGSFFNS
jgi:hypothetical protein